MKLSKSAAIFSILIISISLAIVLVLLYFLLPKSPQSKVKSILAKKGPLQYCTVDSDCFKQGICETTCKQPIGGPCLNIYECSSEATSCTGFCEKSAIGSLHQPCPCGDGLTCGIDSTNPLRNICLKSPGFPCIANSECLSELCVGDSGSTFCSKTLSDGKQCVFNSSCTSNNCSLGYCQPVGLTTGIIDSFCSSYPDETPLCNSNIGLRCNQLSRCVIGTQEFGEICSASNECKLPYICVNENYSGKSLNPGVCMFPPRWAAGNLPDSCVEGTCPIGYTCGSGTCLPNLGQPCTIICNSGTCNNKHTLVKYNSTTISWDVFPVPLAPIGLLNTDLFKISVTQITIGVVIPYDTIFLANIRYFLNSDPFTYGVSSYSAYDTSLYVTTETKIAINPAAPWLSLIGYNGVYTTDPSDYNITYFSEYYPISACFSTLNIGINKTVFFQFVVRSMKRIYIPIFGTYTYTPINLGAFYTAIYYYRMGINSDFNAPLLFSNLTPLESTVFYMPGVPITSFSTLLPYNEFICFRCTYYNNSINIIDALQISDNYYLTVDSRILSPTYSGITHGTNLPFGLRVINNNCVSEKQINISGNTFQLGGSYSDPLYGAIGVGLLNGLVMSDTLSNYAFPVSPPCDAINPSTCLPSIAPQSLVLGNYDVRILKDITGNYIGASIASTLSTVNLNYYEIIYYRNYKGVTVTLPGQIIAIGSFAIGYNSIYAISAKSCV